MIPITTSSRMSAAPPRIARPTVVPGRGCCSKPIRPAGEALAIKILPLSPDAPQRLAALRAETRRRLPDCCVLLAAISTKAEVATFDERLALAATQLGITVHH